MVDVYLTESCKARNYIEIDYVCNNSMPEAFSGSIVFAKIFTGLVIA